MEKIKIDEIIEKITKEFRNPSAHTNELGKIDALKCFNIVIDVEKLLKNILDSFVCWILEILGFGFFEFFIILVWWPT